jgi:hypothetical protein
MSMFDDVAGDIAKTTGTLDKASNILGDNAPGGGAAGDSAVKYYQGEWIGSPPDGVGGSTAPFDLRVQDTGRMIELIHCGWVHCDYCKNFPHGSLPDDGDAKLPQDPPMPGSRAIMFRDALERETLLLSGFVASTQQVLMDKEQGESGNSAAGAGGAAGSAFGAVAGVASDMLGSGGSNSSGGAKSTDFNSANSKVKSVGGTVNTAAPTYTITHKAGEDLHQARAAYRTALDKLRNPPPANPSSGLLSSVNSLASMTGPAGKILNLVEGIYTKVFDIYVGVYGELAARNELAIEKACHDLSLAAIEQNKMPIFAPWFIKTDDSDDSDPSSDSGAPMPGLSMGTGQQNDLGDQLQQAPGQAKKAGQDAAEKSLSKLLEVDTSGYFGSQYLTDAMAVMAGSAAQDQPKPPDTPVGTVVAQTFEKVLGVSVGVVSDVIAQIMETDSEFLEAIFSKLIALDPSQTISGADVYAVARKRLLQKLVDIAISKLQFLQNLEKQASDPSILKSASDPNKQVKGEDVMKKGGAFALDEMTDKLSVAMDPVLQFAMGDLAAKLDAFRSTAVAQKAMTMEIYLGRLPYLRALLFRNTFFPVWDLLIKEVFGNTSGPIQSFLDSSRGFFKTADDSLDPVRDTAGKVKAVDDQFEKENHNVQVGSSSNVQDYQDAWNKGGASKTGKDATAPKVEQDFPIQGRLTTASADPIKRDEWLKIEMIADKDFTNFPPDITPKSTPAPAAAPAAPSTPSWI